MSRTNIRPQRIGDFPKIYRDTLAHWCAFRNLGFGADDIFFGFGAVDYQTNMVHLQLQTQGKKFTVVMGQLPGATRSKVIKTWMRMATLAQESEMAERDACYRDHLIGSNVDYFAAFVLGIQAKGIVIPELPELTPHAGQA